jgi:solute carrier family 35 (UDP-sugar transporter), member A1/2/3
MLNLGFKATILVAVCLQNAGYTLLRKYSTMTEDVSSREILLVGEVIKVVVATYFTYNNSITRSEPSDARGTGLHRLWWLLANSWKMLVVALIYGAMNILSFVALQYIGAGEFTVCAQLKILSTASASVLILNRPLTATKWRALALLVLGCILVAYSTLDAHKDTGGAESVNQENSAGNTLPASPLNQIMPKDGNEWVYGQVLGYIAVITEVCLSGFASIYFEKVVKSTNEVITIWERNFQLGVFSMIMYGSKYTCYTLYAMGLVSLFNAY